MASRLVLVIREAGAEPRRERRRGRRAWGTERLENKESIEHSPHSKVIRRMHGWRRETPQLENV